jgi:hypothetical protein
MNKEPGKAILPFKVEHLLRFIMEKKKMGSTDAMYYLYSSDLYKDLPSEATKYWYLSSPALYEMLEKEKRTGRKKESTDSKVMLFLIFCIESYKEDSSYTGEEVISLFRAEGVFDFLEQHFDVLHTQGKAYITEEIKLYLGEKK